MKQPYFILGLTVFIVSVVFIIGLQELKRGTMKAFHDLKADMKYQQNINNMNYLILSQQRKALKELLLKLDEIIMHTCPDIDENDVKLFSKLFDTSKGVPCNICKDIECDPKDENSTFSSIFYPIYKLFDEMMEVEYKNV